jgi:carnitine 3-dehydrogenase / betainyl-CoA thioesterase
LIMAHIKKAAVIGGGVIGGGWVARLLENGVDVKVFDPDNTAPQKVDAILENANLAAENLIDAPRPAQGTLNFCDTIDQAVQEVELIIEAVPENLELKHSVYDEIERHAANQALIASSTSGLLPSELQQNLQHPERLLVAHPFNPVYLLPLVELVGGKKTSTDTIERAKQIYQSLGMRPLHVRKEIEAFIADRFLEAVWREALWMIKDDIATTQEIDDAIRFGFGLRWAQMGMFETYRMAGGDAGMRHFIAQFGPCLKWPWTKLMDVPELTDELTDKIASQSDAQSGQYSIGELERIRDRNLVGILKALKANDWGAGQTLQAYEASLRETSRGEH